MLAGQKSNERKKNKYEEMHGVWLTPDPKVPFPFSSDPKSPAPAEPGQLKFLLSWQSGSLSFLLQLCGADPSLWVLPLPAQSTQTKLRDQRILQYKQSLKAILSFLKLPVFDDEKLLGVLTSENELFENMMVIYLVRLKEKMWVSCLLKLCNTRKNFGRRALL